MKKGAIRAKARRQDHLGFDDKGRPLPMDSAAVKAMFDQVWDDPASELVAVVLRYKGELFLQVMGAPSKETHDDLQQALRMAVEGYGNVVRGH